MRALVLALPAASRPRSVLYPASGVHLAPLVLCEALPAGEPFTLDLTEMDPSVAGPIGDLLGDMEAAGTLSGLSRESGDGGGWRFVLSGHRVRVRLLLRESGPGGSVPLLDSGLVEGHGMVVSHDWSGDPVTNLGVILALLDATREAGLDRPPLLMMEDLEAHPFPIDLGLFGVLARVGLPYGHRVPENRLGTGHARIELGRPIFGGGVVLGFGDRWWRGLSRQDLVGVFDLLVFARYGWSRRNVLAPGTPPLAAPEVLDWWTAYGARTVGGEREPPFERTVRRIVRAALAAAPAMRVNDRRRLCSLLVAFRKSLERIAAGRQQAVPPVREVSLDVMPSAMRRAYRRALRENAVLRPREHRVLRERASRALALFSQDRVRRLLAGCGAAD